MTDRNYLFTSESVSEGHPDKVCDRISDMIVDTYLSKEPHARVACETLTTTNKVVLAGEVRGPKFNNDQLVEKVRDAIKDIGYDQSGFSWKTADIQTHLHEQSTDIAMGVDSKGNKDEGAGDQGIMFGYACKETKELMPLPIALAHQLTLKQAQIRKAKGLSLRPDAKSQVAVEYSDDYKPKRIDSIVLSTQHDPDLSLEQLRELVKSEIIEKIMPQELLDNKTKLYINPAGRFEIGGPVGDCGLTGRKIMVDTYGGMARHGGGAFSGKDPSKVDRSAAYALRQVAKSLVANDLCGYCEIQASYAIGIAEPTSVFINTFESEEVPVKEIEKIVRDSFDLTPSGIISSLKLYEIEYKKTAAYGHFGREDQYFSWENTVKF